MGLALSNASLQQLRRLHGWIGLGGASFGLLFGLTGFFMSHRAVLRLPEGAVAVAKVQVALDAPPAGVQQLGLDLAERFHYAPGAVRTRVQPGRAVVWSGQKVMQPEQWNLTFTGTRRFARATFVVGNRTVELEETRAGLLETLKRIHQASGNRVAWTLLADAFAFALVFLSLSGVLLWTRLAPRRLLAAGLVLAGAGGMVVVAALF